MTPGPRINPAFAYDPEARSGYLFGGTGLDGPVDDVWKLDNGTWTGPVAIGATRPPMREAATAVYSTGDRAIIYYGGYIPYTWTEDGQEVVLNDLWLWNGEWHRTGDGGLRPPARHGQALAYDSIRNRLVLYGGIDFNGPTSGDQDTWEWDGVTWARFAAPSPDAAPDTRSRSAMAFDAARGKILLCGGDRMNGPHDEECDTWEWDGTRWERKTPATPLSLATSAQMVYDPDRKTIVMFNTVFSWEWNGTDWTQDEVTRMMPRDCAAIYDLGRKRVMTYGGYEINSASNASRRPSGVWERVAGKWNSPAVPVELAPRYIQRIVEDTHRGVMVVLGADGTSAEPNAVWEHDGSSWTGPLPLPPEFNNIDPGVAFDDLHNELVVAGGKIMLMPTEYKVDDRVWRRGTAGWSGPKTHPGPGPRVEHVFAYMKHTSTCVLVGGHKVQHGKQVRDTWALKGAGWTALNAATSPTLNFPCAFAYDANREKLVLCDGNETWEFDGQNWRRRDVAHPISEVLNPAMAYDRVRRRTVLVGQASFVFPVPNQARRVEPSFSRRTWEWDGIDWHLMKDGDGNPTVTPPVGHWVLAFSEARQKVVCFGRDRNGWALEENWQWDGESWSKIT